MFGLFQRLVPPKQFVLGKIRSIQKVFVNCCFIRWNNENGDLQKGKTFSPSGLDKEIPSTAYTVVAILFRSYERAKAAGVKGLQESERETQVKVILSFFSKTVYHSSKPV